MKRYLIFVMVLVICLSNLLSFSATLSAKQIAQSVFPSVVILMMSDENGQPLSLGSGFFVDKDIIATNFHVIEGTSSGYAKIVGQKQKYEIEGTVGIDMKHDIALLQVKNTGALSLQIGNSENIAVGDKIYAVGNPLGLEGTFSDGIISGIRHIETDNLLQITAPISPGSSGGPILNEQGETVGIAVATYTKGQNLNLAIPSSYLSNILKNKTTTRKLNKRELKASEKSIVDSTGEQIKDGVILTHIVTKPDLEIGKKYNLYPNKVDFSIYNKLNQSVKNITVLIIFYAKDGEPIDICQETFENNKKNDGTIGDMFKGDPVPIPAKLAKRYSISLRQEGYEKMELRILNFDILNE